MQILLQWKSNKYYIYYVRVCSLSYPAFTGHSPYYMNISNGACKVLHHFSTYLINGTIFGNTLLHIICVFSFSVQIVLETFLIMRRSEGNMIIYIYIYIYVFM